MADSDDDDENEASSDQTIFQQFLSVFSTDNLCENNQIKDIVGNVGQALRYYQKTQAEKVSELRKNKQLTVQEEESVIKYLNDGNLRDLNSKQTKPFKKYTQPKKKQTRPTIVNEVIRKWFDSLGG